MAEDAMTEALPRSKSQLAYSYIRERIDDGRYSPGFRLVLPAIAGELGVSAVPVREAIRLLEAEGLVEFERNVGARVAMANPREYEITMQTLSLIEGWATATAAPLLTKEDIAAARKVNDGMTKSLEHFDPAAFTAQNRQFHSVLFEKCPNPRIRELVDRDWARLGVLRESIFSFVPDRSRDSVAEHEHILQLIEQGADPLEIEMAARQHRLTTLDAFLKHEAQRHETQRQGAQPHVAQRQGATEPSA